MHLVGQSECHADHQEVKDRFVFIQSLRSGLSIHFINQPLKVAIISTEEMKNKRSG